MGRLQPRERLKPRGGPPSPSLAPPPRGYHTRIITSYSIHDKLRITLLSLIGIDRNSLTDADDPGPTPRSDVGQTRLAAVLETSTFTLDRLLLFIIRHHLDGWNKLPLVLEVLSSLSDEAALTRDG